MTLTVPPDIGDVIDLNAAINDDQEVDLVPPRQRQGRPRPVALRLLPSEVERLARSATSREINMRLAARAPVAAKAAADRLVA